MAQIHLPEAERKLSPREDLAVRYAERMASDFKTIPGPFLDELKAHFDDAEIVELGLMIGQYLAMGRMLVVSGAHKIACEIYVPDADA